MAVISERDPYGVLFHTYWTGETGRALQTCGGDAVILGLYLATNRHANMIGLYELPLLYVEHDLPVIAGGRAAILLAFDHLARVGFAFYDAAAGVVWVAEMARYRCGLPDADVHLPANDKRRAHVRKLYRSIRDNAFLGSFYRRYHVQLGLTDPRTPQAPSKPLPRGNPPDLAVNAHEATESTPDAPSKPLASPLGGPPISGSGSGSGSGSVRTGALDQLGTSNVGARTNGGDERARAPLRGSSIVKPRNFTAAFEGPRVYVPQALHNQFIALRNHADAERELLAWYGDVSEAWAHGAHARDETGADMFVFWKARYAERWPAAAAKPAASSRKHRPAWASPPKS